MGVVGDGHEIADQHNLVFQPVAYEALSPAVALVDDVKVRAGPAAYQLRVGQHDVSVGPRPREGSRPRRYRPAFDLREDIPYLLCSGEAKASLSFESLGVGCVLPRDGPLLAEGRDAIAEPAVYYALGSEQAGQWYPHFVKFR